MELISFLAIVLGVLGGFKLMGTAMLALEERFHIDETFLPYISFAVVFVIIVILVSFLGRIIKISIQKTFLGAVDQAAGALLGLLKTAFMLSIVIWIIESIDIDLHPHHDNHWGDNSFLYPLIAGFAPKVTSWLSEIFPVFRDIF
jgi:membrane protein required for colicin V production